ncbi:MAG: flippase-like domain-containing protein [Sphingomonadales bacterium]|nr:flippase-like domain-containing protein [Sphingomonadales bacterium]
MTERRRHQTWIAGLLPFLAVVVVLGGVAANAAMRRLLGDAWSRIDWRVVAVTLPGQLAAQLFYAAALLAMRPGVSFARSFVSRLLRDAGCNLLVVMAGLGEAIGARVLVLLGARGRVAITATALDAFAEALAQIPYLLLALTVVQRFWHRMRLPLPQGAGVLATGFVALLGVVAAGLVLHRFRHAPLLRHLRVEWHLLRHLRVEWHLLRREMRRRRGGFPTAIGWHFLGWGMGGVQLWLAARMLGVPLSPFAAVAVDSTAYGLRGIAFFVPAGVVLQEAGLVGAGLVFGLAPAQALALALALRLRDVVLGSSILAWPLLEWRRGAISERRRDRAAGLRARARAARRPAS